MIKIKIMLGLGICLYAINLFAEITNDDWVRVYDGKIAEIYLQSDTTTNAKPIPLDKVFIAISADPKEKDHVDGSDPLILVNYLTNKQSKPGCVYTPNKTDTFKNYRGVASSDVCEKLTGLKQVKLAFHECYEKHYGAFFVSFDFLQTQCLNDLSDSKNDHIANLTMEPSNKEGYIIASWSEFANGYKKISYPDVKNYYGAERQGISNYYNSYQNKILGCQDYGQPFSRLTKEMPQDYFIKNKSFYFAENDPYDHVALWQKQYLIKTNGFYDNELWGAWRVIDEPINIGLNLNDGTALLKGVSSILRVRYVDGETKAPESIVKVKEPSEIRAYFNKHGGLQNCTGEDIAASGNCSLDYVPKYPESKKLAREDFYKTIIEATDKIIQEYFEQGDKQWH